MASNSLNHKAYEYIRTQIMLGQMLPGQLLSENELADALNMSRTPVRGAIAQLEHEGIVVSLKNRGILIKEVSMKEMLDMSEVLHAFQLLTLAHMEASGDMPDMKQLKSHLDAQYEATERGEYATYVEHSYKFISGFIAVLGNNSMLHILDNHAKKVVLYATAVFYRTPNEPHYSGNGFHQSIYDALTKEDLQQLRSVLLHIYHTNRERLLRTGGI